MMIENVDYTTKIPNNVNLTEDRQVLRALLRGLARRMQRVAEKH